MERDKIIKALEFCAEHEYCVSCPCDNECIGMESLMLDALSLIKELTEENESLKKTIDRLGKNNDEIARVYPLAIKEAEANTVRKMQERLKAKAYTNNYCQDVVLLSNIDQIAREMLEDTNES